MNINFMAPINDVSYGIVGWNLLKELDKIANPTLWAVPNINNVHPTEENHEVVKRCLGRQQNFDYDAPSVRLWHAMDMAQHVGRGIRWGFPIFELDTFPANEVQHLEWLDGILVCSEWAKGMIDEQIGHGNVSVVPLGVDTSIFNLQPANNSPITTFLNIGKWEFRKGHDLLVDAFNQAFNKDDKVSLWMACHNFFLEPNNNKGVDGNKEWIDLYKNSKLGDKIDILPRMKSQREVAHVMNQVDCGVFPTRAEGWNLELLEMMACGKDVIATNYSGHTEFANVSNCKLLDIDGMSEAYDGKFFFGDGNWAEPNMDQLVEYMRKVHKCKQKGVLGVNNAGIDTARQFSWENSARRLLGAIMS